MRIALALAALVALLLAGGRASAHAQLVDADPPPDAVVAAAPAAVTLRFSEPVRPLALRWFLPDGQAEGTAPRAEGERLFVPLPASAGTGTLLLSWRVVSADGHPISGSHAFSIGRPTQVGAAEAARLPWGAAASRGLLTLALVLGVGGSVFLRIVRPFGALPRARRLALAAACAVAPAALLAAGLHGLDLLGAPAGALLGAAPWAAALASPFAATAAAALLSGAAAVWALDRGGPAGAVVAWAVAAVSFAFFGHAASAAPRWLTVPAVALHAGAFIFWLGALPGLAEAAARDPRSLAPTLHRFSALALPLVGLLVLTGLAIAAVQLPRPGALIDTAYGLLLSAKLALVCLLLGLAALNRLRLTPAIERHAPGAASRFQRSVFAEIGLGLLILVLASGFRLTPPPRSMPAAPPGAHIHLHGSTVMADLTLQPARAGANMVEIRLATMAASASDPAGMWVGFAQPAQGVEPIRLAAVWDGAVWRAGPLPLPHGGVWEVTLDVLVSDFAKETLRATMAVQGP